MDSRVSSVDALKPSDVVGVMISYSVNLLLFTEFSLSWRTHILHGSVYGGQVMWSYVRKGLEPTDDFVFALMP